MASQHPLLLLQQDLDKVLTNGNSKILELLKPNMSNNNKDKVKSLLREMIAHIHDRTQIELQRAQRKETENSVFISGDTLKSKTDVENLVFGTLKTKYKSEEIGYVDVERIKTKNKNKQLYKVQLKSRHEQKVVIEKNGKQAKVSLTTALHSIVRDKPEILKPKRGKQITMQRQIPGYLHDHKKSIDHIAKIIRDTQKFQTKTNFNVKENAINAKYRKNKKSGWKCMFEEPEDLPDDIQEKLEEMDWPDYINDEKYSLERMLKKN